MIVSPSAASSFSLRSFARRVFLLSLALAAMAAAGTFALTRRMLHHGRVLNQKLSHSLKEKETLLREVHHRVKNNMQLISSLLSLESRDASSDCQRTLKETQGRIRSMAVLHDLLYRSEGMEAVNFGQFLKIITDRIRITLPVDRRITIDLEIDEAAARIDLETAIPAGLILNEILAAFIERSPDGMKVSLSLTNDGEQRKLRIFSDADLSRMLSEFKQDITRTLTRQIKGGLEGPVGPGTVYVLRFPVSAALGGHYV